MAYCFDALLLVQYRFVESGRCRHHFHEHVFMLCKENDFEPHECMYDSKSCEGKHRGCLRGPPDCAPRLAAFARRTLRAGRVLAGLQNKTEM
eukprot:314348-Amphidinium_carterae.1